MKDSTVLTFTGDIGFDHFMENRWEDDELVAKEILDVMRASDHVIINVEGPLIDSASAKLVSAREMRLMHTIDPAAVLVFDRLKADVWNLCNNHIMDAGEAGLRASLDEAKRAGVRTLGVGMNVTEAARPVIFDEAGGIGMFAVGYQRGCKPAGEDKGGCLNWAELDVIGDTINEIKKTCRWCIIVSHGGEEFTSLPSPYTRDRYLKYLDMGADIIVCHHPHVPMNYEIISGSGYAGDDGGCDKTGEERKKKAIFYSLGNFIFDTPYQRAQYNTEKGIVLSLSLDEDDFGFKAYGIRIDRESER
ncbi:MAG: CapA family protein, partial [Eubacterium sp.]|nr:CapA family protein [Eubacterium sp.]